MPTAAVGGDGGVGVGSRGGASGVEGDGDGDALPAGEVVSRELIEGAREAARKDERSRVRAMLHTEAPLKDAAENAVRDLLRLLATPPAEGDASAPVADASGLEAISEELVKERLVSASLQAMIDQHEEQVRLKIAAERRACQLLLARNDPSEVESGLAAQLEAARRRNKALAAQASQQRAEIHSLKALNAQLLNEADPLLLTTGRARINWPRAPDLHRTPAPRPRTRPAPPPSRPCREKSARRPRRCPRRRRRRRRHRPRPPLAARARGRCRPRALLGIALAAGCDIGGLSHARIVRRSAPPLGDAIETVVSWRKQPGQSSPAAAAAASASSASSTYRERWNTK